MTGAEVSCSVQSLGFRLADCGITIRFPEESLRFWGH